MKTIAVILSGCGVFDGSEIHESVLSLLALDRAGARYQCFAPNHNQHHVIDHITGSDQQTARNMLSEAARIARGDIKPLSELVVSEFDAVLVPGGFGAAKNLCNFAFTGSAMTVLPEWLTVAKQFASQSKPAGYICIAPVMMPAIYGAGIKLTIGNDAETAAAVTAMGGVHVDCSVTEIVVDHAHKALSTPAYMLAQSISEAAIGIDKLVQQLLAMA